MAEYLKGERMRTSERILQEVKKAVIGKDELLEKILMAILANGHILMEDMPGVGKTTIARVCGCDAAGLPENAIYSGCITGRCYRL